MCCCGSLSFFRTAVVRRHLDDFLHQSFLGIQVQYGDDRRLTQYALQDGLVRLQDTAVAYTLVPETLGHYRRQQLRWNRSFFRESLWAIQRFGPRRWPFWISVAELAVWMMFTISLLAAVYVRPVLTCQMIPWSFVAFAVVLAYAQRPLLRAARRVASVPVRDVRVRPALHGAARAPAHPAPSVVTAHPAPHRLGHPRQRRSTQLVAALRGRASSTTRMGP